MNTETHHIPSIKRRPLGSNVSSKSYDRLERKELNIFHRVCDDSNIELIPSSMGEPYLTTISKVYCKGTSHRRDNIRGYSLDTFTDSTPYHFSRRTLLGGCLFKKQRVPFSRRWKSERGNTRLPNHANVNLGQTESSRDRRLISIWFLTDSFSHPVSWLYSLLPEA